MCAGAYFVLCVQAVAGWPRTTVRMLWYSRQPCLGLTLVCVCAVDAQIKLLQEKRGIAFGGNSLDRDVYGSSTPSSKYAGYVQSIAAGDEDDEPDQPLLPTRKAGPRFLFEALR